MTQVRDHKSTYTQEEEEEEEKEEEEEEEEEPKERVRRGRSTSYCNPSVVAVLIIGKK